MLEIRSHAAWYLKGVPNSGELKKEFYACKTKKEMLEKIGDNYEC